MSDTAIETPVTYISPSRMGSFDKCGLAFQYDTELPRLGGGSVRGTGTGYHAGLELFYRARMEDKPEPTVDECVAYGVGAFRSDVAKTDPDRYVWAEKVPTEAVAIELIERMVRAYFADPNAVYPADWRVIAVEAPFLITGPTGTVGFRGVVDLALMAPDGGVVGDDQKTNGSYGWKIGKESPRKQPQPPIYRAALQELWPDAPYYRFVFSIMTYGVLKKSGERSDCKFERRVSDPGTRHVDATWRKAQQIITLYNGMRAGGMDLPANTSSDLCSPAYCDHWSYCAHGQALD